MNNVLHRIPLRATLINGNDCCISPPVSKEDLLVLLSLIFTKIESNGH